MHTGEIGKVYPGKESNPISKKNYAEDFKKKKKP
jgi:hypothetical protein